jgi:hypothetical protein
MVLDAPCSWVLASKLGSREWRGNGFPHSWCHHDATDRPRRGRRPGFGAILSASSGLSGASLSASARIPASTAACSRGRCRRRCAAQCTGVTGPSTATGRGAAGERAAGRQAGRLVSTSHRFGQRTGRVSLARGCHAPDGVSDIIGGRPAQHRASERLAPIAIWLTPAETDLDRAPLGTGMPVVRWTLSGHPGDKNGANEHGEQA